MNELLNVDSFILLLYIDKKLIVGHDTKKTQNLEKNLSMSVIMKNLESGQNICGMMISHDSKNGKS